MVQAGLIREGSIDLFKLPYSFDFISRSFGNAANRTWWVRSANATSVLCQPHIQAICFQFPERRRRRRPDFHRVSQLERRRHRPLRDGLVPSLQGRAVSVAASPAQNVLLKQTGQFQSLLAISRSCLNYKYNTIESQSVLNSKTNFYHSS